MSTLTIDRPTSQADEPPCTNPWCRRHDTFGDVCTGTQARLGDHAATLTRGPGEGDQVYVSLDGRDSVPMSPADLIAFAAMAVEQARVALGDIRVGDRASWTDHNGDAATGTVLSIHAYGGTTHVRVDTDREPGRVHKLTSDVNLDKLTRLPNAGGAL